MNGEFYTFNTLDALQEFETKLTASGFVRSSHYVPFKGGWLLAIECDVPSRDIVTSAAIDYLTDAINGKRGDVEKRYTRCEYGNMVARALTVDAGKAWAKVET